MVVAACRFVGVLAVIVAIYASAFAGDGRQAQRGVAEAAIAADAERDFAKIDLDRSGAIDADEFASAKVVYAQLARFTRRVPIDGAEPFDVPLPADVPSAIEREERDLLDGIARRQHGLLAMGRPGLDRETFVQSRLEIFHTADRDYNGVLEGDELSHYARVVAGALPAGFAAS